MRIVIPGFSGLNKRLAPQRIAETESTDCLDCDFRSGDLRGYLTDTGPVTTTHPGANVTIFEYDSTKTLVATGVYDIVRSPIVEDTKARIYFTKYDQTDLTNRVGIIDSTMLSAGVNGIADINSYKALGVPAPRTPVTPSSIQQSGTLTKIIISTSADAIVTVPASDVAKVNFTSGDSLLLTCPGFSTTAYTVNKVAIDASGNADLYLKNTRRAWKNFTLKFTSGQTTITFSCVAHGFNDGDQVFLSHIKPADTTFPPSNLRALVGLNQVFQVTSATANEFQLQFYDTTNSWTTLVRSSKATTTGTFTTQKKIALLAPWDSLFPDATLATSSSTNLPLHAPSITALSNASYEGNFIYGSGTPIDQVTDFTATWQNADTADLVRDRAYLVTFVNSYGDESAPSSPTEIITVAPKSPVTFDKLSMFLESFDTTNYPLSAYASITEIRLYRTDSTGAWRLVTTDSGDITGTKTKIIRVVNGAIQLKSDGNIYVDTATDSSLGETLVTQGWDVAPKGVQGLISVPGGMVLGFKQRTVYPSVAYIPYAYPVANRLATDADIVGLVGTAAGIAVLTNGMPYLVTGSDPSSLSMVKLEKPYACASRTSIVDMGDFGIYASPDGLIAVMGAEIKVLTEETLTRAQWQAYNPSTIIAGRAEGKYIATYLDGSTRKGFVYDTVTGSFSPLTLAAVGFFNSPKTDILRYATADGSLYQWGQGTTYRSYFWKSKVFQLPKPSLFGCAQVVAYGISTDTPLTFKLFDYDTGTQIGSSISVTAANPFRLPSGARYQNLQITLEGKASVSNVVVATTIDELKEV